MTALKALVLTWRLSWNTALKKWMISEPCGRRDVIGVTTLNQLGHTTVLSVTSVYSRWTTTVLGWTTVWVWRTTATSYYLSYTCCLVQGGSLSQLCLFGIITCTETTGVTWVSLLYLTFRFVECWWHSMGGIGSWLWLDTLRLNSGLTCPWATVMRTRPLTTRSAMLLTTYSLSLVLKRSSVFSVHPSATLPSLAWSGVSSSTMKATTVKERKLMTKKCSSMTLNLKAKPTNSSLTKRPRTLTNLSTVLSATN